jgi:hypothetical protein
MGGLNSGLNWLCTIVDVVAGRAVMNDKTDEYWGTLILEMAEEARQDGDFCNGRVAHSRCHKIFR